MALRKANEEQGMVSQFGPIEVNWPRTIGYYGGIALAVGFELIEPPVGIFIASIPPDQDAEPPETVAAGALRLRSAAGRVHPAQRRRRSLSPHS